MFRVHITGYRPGLRKIGTKAIRTRAELSLADAKRHTDAVLCKNETTVILATREAAERLAAELNELGADAASVDS